MGRHQTAVLQQAQRDTLHDFYQSRGAAWLRQHQYCLGADYMLRALNMRPKCPANLLLGKACGMVLGEPDLVSKCDAALSRGVLRTSSASSVDHLRRSPRLSEQRKSDVLAIVEDAVQISRDASRSPRVESLDVRERRSIDDVQSMVDEAVCKCHGALSKSSAEARLVVALDPKDSIYGRGLYANQRLKQGTVVLGDALLVAQRFSGACCEYCLGALSKNGSTQTHGVACDHCATDTYCSASCRDAAWAQYHQCLCAGSNPQFAQWAAQTEALVQSGGSAEDAGADAKAALACLTVAKLLGMATMAQVHPLELRGLSHLRGFVEYDARSGLSHMGAMAVTLAEALHQPNLFVEEILTLLAMVQTNEFLGQQGIALYPVLSLLNHSCTPNCVVAGPSLHQQQLVTVKDVRAGEQLLIDYNPRLTGSLTYQQRKALFQQRNFECFCSRCILKK